MANKDEEIFKAITEFEARGDQDVLDAAAKIDREIKDRSATIDIKTNVDDSELQTAKSSLLDLEDDASVKVNVDDSEVTSSLLILDDLNEDADVKVNVDDSEADEALAVLEQLRALAIIDVVLNLPENLTGLVDNIPGLSTLVDIQAGQDIFSAATGGGDTGKTNSGLDPASALFAQGFGNIEDNARFLATISNLTGEIDPDVLLDYATNAYEAAVAIEGISGQAQDVNTIFVQQKKLLESDVVKSYKGASDFMVSGFQSIIGYSGDFLGDLGEFAPLFGALGFTSEQVLNTLNTGLGGGVDNISRFAEILPSFVEQASSANDAFVESVEAIGDNTGVDLTEQLDAYEQGTLSGADFISGILDAARNYTPTGNDATLQTLLPAIFGSTTSNIGADTLLKIDPNASQFDDIEGASKEAADAIRDNIGAALTEIKNTLEVEVAQTLDETFDLSDRIETAQDQFQTFIDNIQDGKSVGEAIEISFGIEGVDTALLNIERVFGNLVIGILQAVSLVQQIQGVDNSGTKSEIARLSENQLAFDLQVANADEVGEILGTALSRGVDSEGLGAALRTSVEEAFAGGDFAQGLNIIDGLMEATIANGNDTSAAQAFADSFKPQLQEGFDTAIAEGDFDIAKKIADAQGDPTAYTDALKGKFAFDAAAFDSLAADFSTGMETAIAAETPTPDMAWADLWTVPEEVTTSIQNFETDVDTAVNNAALASSLASDGMLEALAAMSDGVVTADEEIAFALTENTVTASFDAVLASAEANFPAAAAFTEVLAQSVKQLDANVSGNVSHMTGELKGLAALVSSVFAAVETAKLAGASVVGSGGGTTNVNVVQNNNIASGAENAAANDQLLTEIKGGI